jgi:Spy/CpxP family protein refolding chaperone
MQKRMLCLALSTVFSIGTVLAAPQDAPPAAPQDQGPPPGGAGQRQPMDPDRMVMQLSKQLKLSDDQANQIRPIVTEQMNQMAAIRGDSSLAPRDRMAKMMSLRTDTATKIKAILNPDQQAKYDAMQQQQMDRMRQRRAGPGDGNGGAPPPPDSNN